MDILYRCAGCGMCYSNEEGAITCEALHPQVEDFRVIFDAEDKVSVEQIEFKIGDQVYRYNVYNKRAVETLGETPEVNA